MKKVFIAALLAAFAAVSLVAQEVPGTSASTKECVMADVSGILNTSTYFAYFGSNQKEVSRKYVDLASDADYERFSNLGGDVTDVDTPLEFTLLSYYSQPVINIRPVEADAILPKNDPRTAGLKLSSAVLKELAELKFLDPSNTAAIGRYEGMIKFISDKNGVTRAEIESYYRQGIEALIAETVDAEFNKISFMVDRKYDVVLTRNMQNQYILSYERPEIPNSLKTLTGTSLEALLTAMLGNTADFNQACVNEVRSQAALIPAVAGTDNMLQVITAVITAFYNSQTATNYTFVGDIYMILMLNSRTNVDPFYSFANSSYIHLLGSLNTQLMMRILKERTRSVTPPMLNSAQIEALTARRQRR
jgi:hypothetical protein